MNILIVSSKSWFTLHKDVAIGHEVTYIHDDAKLTLRHLTTINPDIIFFPHWNKKVASVIHETYLCIVFHTAPLPYGRGGSPIQNLILDGFNEAPVCALKMTVDLDAGPVYASTSVSLEGNLSDIFENINDAVNHLIAELVTGVLPEAKPQLGDPHYFKRRSEEDNEIPDNIDIKKFYDHVRMLDHKDYPKSYIIHGDCKIEFFNAKFSSDEITTPLSSGVQSTDEYSEASVTASCKITKC